MSWEDQGRQEHGWFGNGTAPLKDGESAGRSRGRHSDPAAAGNGVGAEAAAARAHAWAKRYGPALFGLPPSGAELEAFATAVSRIERARPGMLACGLGSDVLVRASTGPGVQAAAGEGATSGAEEAAAAHPRSADSAASAMAAAEAGGSAGVAARAGVQLLGRAVSRLLGSAAEVIAAPLAGAAVLSWPTQPGDDTLTGHGMPLGGYPAPPTTGDGTMAASSGEPPVPGRPTARPRPSGADAANLPPNGPDGPDED